MHSLIVSGSVLIVGLLTLCGLAAAQTPPDAGSLQPSSEFGRTPTLPPRAAPPPEAEAAPLALPDGATLTVRAFTFTGNTLLSDAQLQPTVQPWVDRPVGFGDLQRAARAVADAYRDSGFIVRTSLPQQDVTEGVISIRVVEASFAGARIEGTLPQRVAPAQVLSHFEARQQQGEPLSTHALDRALLLADDLPGVAVIGALEPGARDGETALALRVADEPLFRGEVGGDNGGARSTGAERLTLMARVNSPSGRGDQATADLQRSRGTAYARLGYAVPLGADGWRLGAHASRFGYKLVGSEFSALDAEGSSTGGGLDLTYPVLRSRKANVYAQLTLDHKRYRNQAQGAVQSQYRVSSSGLGLIGNAFDDLGGGGATSWSLSRSSGRVNQGATDPGENPALAGSYNRWRWALARQQALAPRLSAALSASGQHAGKDLDSSERFYLGGPSGVRAYPVNEGSGSRGTLVSLELRWRMHTTVNTSAFYDWGRVASQTAAPDSTLKGAGLALAWNAPAGVDLKLAVARRLGHNPHPTATGLDQDGSLKRVRVWLQANVAF